MTTKKELLKELTEIIKPQAQGAAYSAYREGYLLAFNEFIGRVKMLEPTLSEVKEYAIKNCGDKCNLCNKHNLGICPDDFDIEAITKIVRGEK